MRLIPKTLDDFYKKHNLRAFQCTWLLYVHILGIFGLISMFIYSQNIFSVLGWFVAFWVMYGIGITGGCHRLWAHKSYTASTPLKVILMLWNSGANQGSIFHWSRDHRLHHKYSDTDLDPHDITKGFFFSHCGWLLYKKSPQLIDEGRKIDMSDLKKDPVVMFQKKHYLALSLTMCFAVPTICFWLFTDLPLIASFFMSMSVYIWILNATWCVNSICHMFGTRPWNKTIQPRDNWFVTLMTHGQGYHNWHHEYPSDWRGSKDQWYQLNITARFIELCSVLGLAKVKR